MPNSGRQVVPKTPILSHRGRYHVPNSSSPVRFVRAQAPGPQSTTHKLSTVAKRIPHGPSIPTNPSLTNVDSDSRYWPVVPNNSGRSDYDDITCGQRERDDNYYLARSLQRRLLDFQKFGKSEDDWLSSESNGNHHHIPILGDQDKPKPISMETLGSKKEAGEKDFKAWFCDGTALMHICKFYKFDHPTCVRIAQALSHGSPVCAMLEIGIPKEAIKLICHIADFDYANIM